MNAKAQKKKTLCAKHPQGERSNSLGGTLHSTGL